jgi:hypothetical protein
MLPAPVPAGIGLGAEITVPPAGGLKISIDALITMVKNTPTETATSNNFFFSFFFSITPLIPSGFPIPRGLAYGGENPINLVFQFLFKNLRKKN